MPDWDKINHHVHDTLASDHQRLALGQIHLGAIKESLVGLNSLGFHYDLVEVDPGKPQEYPKMLYKDSPGAYEPVTSIVVHSKDDEEKLAKDGWRVTPLVQAKAPTAAKVEPAKPVGTA